MEVLTPRRSENFVDLSKRLAGGRGVGLGSFRRGVDGRDNGDHRKRNAERRESYDNCTRFLFCGMENHDFTSFDSASSLARIGRRPMRLAVAAKIASVRAGATRGTLWSL